MKADNNFSAITYSKNNPKKSKLIKGAIKRGIKQYGETFRRLAAS